jgi:hypothetical protein
MTERCTFEAGPLPDGAHQADVIIERRAGPSRRLIDPSHRDWLAKPASCHDHLESPSL